MLQAFEEADAAVAPVYDASDIVEDPQLAAIGAIARVEDEQLGPLRMPNVLARLSDTPGTIRWTGRAHGADTDAVLAEAGLDAEAIDRLRRDGVVA